MRDAQAEYYIFRQVTAITANSTADVETIEMQGHSAAFVIDL